MVSSGIFTNVKRVADVVRAVKDATEATTGPVRVGIYVSEGAPTEMVNWVREAFIPQSNSASIVVEPVPAEGVVRMHGSLSFVVLIAGSASSAAEEFMLACATDGVPCAVLAETALEAPEIHSELPEGAQLALLTATSQETFEYKLARWVVDILPETEIQSAARGFEFLRTGYSHKILSDAVVQNAMVGAIGILDGAHLPIMMATQTSMALDLAGIYGVTSPRDTAPVIAGVVAGAFVYRGIARLGIKHLPLVAPIVRTVVAAGGTLLSGYAVRFCFENLPESEDESESEDIFGIKIPLDGGLVKR